MKKLFLTPILCFCFLSITFAQRPDREMPKPEEMAKRQTQSIKDSLKLDEKQTAKVEAINLEYAQKMRKIWDSELGQGEKMQEIQVMNNNKDYEIKKCLTKEQAKRYQKIQDAMRARREERRKKE